MGNVTQIEGHERQPAVRRRRSNKIRKTEPVKGYLTPSDKRRVDAYLAKTKLSESKLVGRLILDLLDREGVVDPEGPPTQLKLVA